MELDLTGKNALVTGAAGGIGRATCRLLAAEGVSLLCADRDAAALDELVGTELPGALPVAVDLTDAAAVRRVADEADAQFGGLDIVVNAAGVFNGDRIEDTTAETWRRVQDINVLASFLVCQATLPLLARRRGRVVNIGSVAGQSGGELAGVAYAVSKTAVGGLTKALARAAAHDGVTVNCVHPGLTETPMTDVWSPEMKEAALAVTPLGRMATPEEVARVVVFLASPVTGFVTGAHWDINGGIYMA